MKVSELRVLLAGLPDEMEVVTGFEDADGVASICSHTEEMAVGDQKVLALWYGRDDGLELDYNHPFYEER